MQPFSRHGIRPHILAIILPYRNVFKLIRIITKNIGMLNGLAQSDGDPT